MQANQATSFLGGIAAGVGGMMAQASPDSSVSNTGIVIGATGLIACLLNGAYPWFKTWLESRTVLSDIEELKASVAKAEAELIRAKAEADRKAADVDARHQADVEKIRQRRHDDRDKFNAMYLKQQDMLNVAQLQIARLEGKLGHAINTNAESIRTVAESLDPPVPVRTPHVDVLPPFSSDDIEAGGPP